MMKRIFDFTLAVILLLPIILFGFVLGILILLIDHFSPLYFQKRIGKDGKIFTCFKLQTMKPAKDLGVIGEREKDSSRITALGEFIRNHGWDELPQIFNVLLGNMSFSGPRPLLQKTYDRIREKNQDIPGKIAEWEKERKSVRPGVSGWHQVQIGFPASMFDYDMEYLQRRSLGMEVRIFFITLIVFLFGKKWWGSF